MSFLALRHLLLPCLFLSGTASFAHASDALFDRMTGEWDGEGERIQLVSGRRIAIHTATVARVEGDRLVSSNEITETASGTTSGTAQEASGGGAILKQYRREYWMRRSPTTAEADSISYELGTAETVTSRGRFDGSTLEVEQNLGGAPAYVIRSSTTFADDLTSYLETVWHGDEQLAETRIEYRRRR
jgi:hypothetical protein